MSGFTGRMKWVLAGVFGVALIVGGWQRAVAVKGLPPDFDELVYLPAAFEYRRMAGEGDGAGIVHYRHNLEHPPMVKLMFAAQLAASDARAPDWDQVRVGSPIPEAAQPAFFGARWLSWLFGMGQLALLGAVHPLGALGLSVSTYHAKYTAQAYLEAVPGLFAVLAVLLFERALRRTGDDGQERPVRRGLLLSSAALVGLATAGKYPYGLVVALGIAPFLPLWLKKRVRWWAAYALTALVVFLVADPFLWPAPVSRFMETVGFHWGFSQSKHVQDSGLPWFQPVYWMTHSEPAKWHRELFFTSVTDWVLLPLAIAGVGRALRVRPVFASWFILGLVFLFLWPTKWPQYILLILPAVSVCAALGVEQLVTWALRWWPRKGVAEPAR